MEEPVKIYFELEKDTNVDSVKSILAEGLAGLKNVEASEVQVPNQRFTGAEMVATIGAVILIAKSTKEAIDTVRDVIASLTDLVKNIKGLKAVIVETKSGPKRLEEVTENDLEGVYSTEWQF